MLALTLIASVSIHYYAVFALLPFAAAELTWSVVNKQRRPRVWLALTAGGLSFVAYWPLLRGLRDTYGQHYWAKASVFRAIASYDEYMSLMTVGAMLGFVAVLSGALLVYLARTVVPRADDPIPPDVPPANCVLALGPALAALDRARGRQGRRRRRGRALHDRRGARPGARAPATSPTGSDGGHRR